MDWKAFWKNVKKHGIRYGLLTVADKLSGSPQWLRELEEQRYYAGLSREEARQELGQWFYTFAGYPLDLENPRTFNEKLQWLKLYDSTPLKTRLADKYAVREWVAQTVGEQHLIPLLGVWESFNDIDFSALPEQYALKCNHGSGMNLVVRKDAPLDRKRAKKTFDYWMRAAYGIGPMQEWHYRDIPHRILAEQYMENLAGDLYDYKFYCFDGEPQYIQLIQGRGSDTRMAFYDTEWQDAGFTHTHFPPLRKKAARPPQLEKALGLARKLSQGFAFVRVDLYLVGEEEVYFGEMTFTPASGVRHWTPEGTDRMLGDRITLPEKYDFWKGQADG